MNKTGRQFVHGRLLRLLRFAGAFIGMAGQLTYCSETKSQAWFYVCSCSKDDYGGIHLAKLDATTGAMQSARLMARLQRTSFVAVHPNQRFLYAACRIEERGSTDDALSAFEIDKHTGALKLLNHQSSAGANPCHIYLDRDGRHALVSNFDGGNISVLPIGVDGRLVPVSAVITRPGSGADRVWQAGPHPHQVVLDSTNRLAYVPDLGLDKVLVYRYDAGVGALTSDDRLDVHAAPGAGPRHLAFHPNGKWVYLINQLNSTIASYQYDATSGKLTIFDVKPMLPNDFKLRNDAAEIVIHATGKFLYGSNRGHDSIAMFSIDQASGLLTNLGLQPAGGRTPTSICLDSTGKLLLSANLNSDNIVVHEVDSITGKLSQKLSCNIPKPICIVAYAK
jgi:6-phosphogluconolactonase